MDIFTELSIVIVAIVVITGLVRLLKQPLIIGYILTGFVLAPFLFNAFNSKDTFNIFSQMGVAILLFIVGLHLNPREVNDYSHTAFLLGFFQIVFTTAFAFLLCLLLGFSPVSAVYLGIGLSLSSTIIVLKMLSDKKDLEKLYGRLAIGISLFQDMVASFALIFTSAFAVKSSGVPVFLFLLAKGFILVPAVYYVGNHVLPKFGHFFAKSQEYLLLFSLAWGFGLASLFKYLGFSLEIGALMAGIALSVSPYSSEISAKLRPLRDFFVVMFFVSLGSQIIFTNIGHLWVPIVILTVFVLIAKPLIIMILMGLFGYNKKTSFLEGITLAQISEFSLVLGLLGVKSGHISEDVLTVLIVVGVISIAVSSYLTTYSEQMYSRFAKRLKIFEKHRNVLEKSIVSNYEVILFGCNRVGYDFIKMFKNLGSGFLVVDFDPAVIASLEKDGVNCVYGDAEDGEFLEDIHVVGANVVISTIPDFESSLFLLTRIRATNKNSIVIVLSYDIDEALRLYEKGASYVVLPHFISGEFAADMAFKSGANPKEIHKRKAEHIEYLQKRKALGHSHPVWSHQI